MFMTRSVLFSFVLFGLAVSVAGAQDSKSPIRGFIERYSADVQTLGHRFRLPLDRAATERRLAVTKDWLVQLREQKFDKLDRVGKVDYLLLKSELEYQLQKIRLDSERDAQAAKLMPYAMQLVAFCKSREDVDTIKPAEVADTLDKVAKAVEAEAKSCSPYRRCA